MKEPTNSPPVTDDDLDARIIFHDDLQVMEVDFTSFRFEDTETVNRFYDRAEARIAATGEPLWFFLINLSDAYIDTAVWFDYSRRGKALNMAHSMGSVRFDPSEATRRQIERDANTEAFDPNLHADRDTAIERLKSLPSKRVKRVMQQPNYERAEFVGRVSFDEADQIMEADFSNFAFHNARDVDDFYDYLDEVISATGRKWFFLVNLNNCEIPPASWVQYAYRGKELNIAHSLGSVRYAAGSETEADIRMRAESQGFRPNIRNTRQEAMERLAEIKDELAAGD
ncbi:hypothetical protein [Nioella nitratireducens]|uniref:hypothetical protein n=1 Tax=Nioella nitratireducens TaxID=1287720 RepID=UPI0008FCFEDF|nr:hypothetical protein [Nioella nitratireducens]